MHSSVTELKKKTLKAQDRLRNKIRKEMRRFT